jgi:hypothetical protein
METTNNASQLTFDAQKEVILPKKVGKKRIHLKKEARFLLKKSIDSFILSIEHFNRPSNVGRATTVLILIDHSFEMLLKSTIIQKGGTIRQKGMKQTIGFDKCLRIAVDDPKITFIKREDALLIQVINNLRDAAYHHLLDISEDQLYLHVQSGVTIFRDILKDSYDIDICDHIPSRILPVSIIPPKDLIVLFQDKIDEVRDLLRPKSRKRTEAITKLRPLAILDMALRGESIQPGDNELRRIAHKIVSGEKTDQLFPGVAAIQVVTSGDGPTLSLRFDKREGIPIQVVPEGTPGTNVVAIKRVDELGFYSLTHTQLAEKVGLTSNKVTAMISCLKMKDDRDCSREIPYGRSKLRKYSMKSIEKITVALTEKPMEQWWKQYRQKMNDAGISSIRGQHV